MFLMETVGTKREEDDSYNNIIILIVVLLLGMVLCSLLEVVFYFLYSLKVRRHLKDEIFIIFFLVVSSS